MVCLLSNHESVEAMFATASILPISVLTLLAASQLASAQTIQPIPSCPPGKVAQNQHQSNNAVQRTANMKEESRKHADSPRVSDSGGGNTHTTPVDGRPLDPLNCR